jgi:hypothetical protein
MTASGFGMDYFYSESTGAELNKKITADSS